MDMQAQKAQMMKLLKKAQKDKALRKRLLENADATLKQEGIYTPPGHRVKFLEREKDTHYFFLPSEQQELSEKEMLQMVAGAPEPALLRDDYSKWS